MGVFVLEGQRGGTALAAPLLAAGRATGVMRQTVFERSSAMMSAPRRVDSHTDRPATGLAVGAYEAGDDIEGWACRATAAKRNKDDLVSDRRAAVPATVLADE